jgi:hypothetical protein
MGVPFEGVRRVSFSRSSSSFKPSRTASIGGLIVATFDPFSDQSLNVWTQGNLHT